MNRFQYWVKTHKIINTSDEFGRKCKYFYPTDHERAQGLNVVKLIDSEDSSVKEKGNKEIYSFFRQRITDCKEAISSTELTEIKPLFSGEDANIYKSNLTNYIRKVRSKPMYDIVLFNKDKKNYVIIDCLNCYTEQALKMINYEVTGVGVSDKAHAFIIETTAPVRPVYCKVDNRIIPITRVLHRPVNMEDSLSQVPVSLLYDLEKLVEYRDNRTLQKHYADALEQYYKEEQTFITY